MFIRMKSNFVLVLQARKGHLDSWFQVLWLRQLVKKNEKKRNKGKKKDKKKKKKRYKKKKML